MISLTLRGIDQIKEKLVKQGEKLSSPGKSITPQTALEIDAIVREHDASVFLRRAYGDWKKISLPAGLWNRQINWVGRPKTVFQAAELVSQECLPLVDSKRLYNSIAYNNSDHVLVVSPDHIMIGTSVEYAAKHFSGDWEIFEFGPEELARLNERFYVPVDGKDPFRDYYRLKTWAEKNYPKRAYVPERSWYEPLPITDREIIAEMVGLDLSGWR